jgi:long-chain acyl-CoA synthetase
MKLVPDRISVALTKNLTLGNFHDRLAELRGDKMACRLHVPLPYRNFTGKDFSYKDSALFISTECSALIDMGIKPGDRVGICTANNADQPLGVFAVARAGGVAVPMNAMLKAKEIRYIVENCGAETLIVDKDVFENNIMSKQELPSIKRWIMAGPEKECSDGFISLDGAMAAAYPGGPQPPIDAKQPVAVFYTSGTTGFPKGATMTSRSLLTAQKISASLIPLGSNAKGVFCLPAAHVMGFGCYIMGACLGLSAYYMPHFAPKEVLEALEREKATVFVGVPAMYTMMMAEGIDKYDLSSMKMFGSAADAMPQDLMEAFRNKGTLLKVGPWRARAFFVEVYGMVELAGVATMKIAIMGLNYPAGCVGWPVPPVRVHILDEDGTRLPAEEVGEVAVAGPGITTGYWDNKEATDELVKKGWLLTGDMGKKDRLGRLHFVDRKKDVIKVGGYSVFSVEVEQEVLDHPAVADVSVVGIPHPLKKQVPLAVVTLKEGALVSEDEILAWCKEHIAGYKSPRAVRILAPEELPYGMTLKVRKLELRERFADLFMNNAEELQNS